MRGTAAGGDMIGSERWQAGPGNLRSVDQPAKLRPDRTLRWHSDAFYGAGDKTHTLATGPRAERVER